MVDAAEFAPKYEKTGDGRVSDLTITLESVQNKLDEYCSALSKVGSLNGSVLVAFEGNILFNKGYGAANLEHGISNTPQTVFRVGSITKQFTAASVLLLQESGLIHVTDPISKHLPDYPNGDKISIHHLLTHTSGIPCFTDFGDYRKNMKIPTTLEESVSKFRDLPLIFKPGEKFEYCNSGYVLLAYLIEKIANKTFESFLQESIFNVLGMEHTGYDDFRKVIPNRASGYGVWGETRHAEYIDMSVPSGAGALYSTTEDLFIWNQSLHSGKFLNHRSYEMMTTPDKGSYGYGLFVVDEEINGEKRKVIAHDGGINGFLSECRHYEHEDLTIIVLSNMVPTTQPGSVAHALARLVLGDEIDYPKSYTPIHFDSDQYGDLVGDYQVNDDPSTTFVVSIEKNKLYVMDEQQFKFEILPFSQDEESTKFFFKGMQGTVTFVKREVHVELFGTKIATKQ